MIRITVIDREHRQDIRLPNEPFALTGRVVPSYVNERWSYEVRPFPPERVGEMCCPDENYDYDEMKDSVFLGAYEDEKCVGLAVLQPGFFRYLYLYDLNVCRAYRGQKIGALLMDKAREIALQQGYRGLVYSGTGQQRGRLPVLSALRVSYWWTGYGGIPGNQAGRESGYSVLPRRVMAKGRRKK